MLDALECIRELDPSDSEQRVRGLSLLSMISLSQQPEAVREAIKQCDEVVDRIILADRERSLFSRVYDWFWVHV